jgi:hypothetical protein
MRTTWRGVFGGLVGIGIVTTTATPARASDDIVPVLFAVAAGIVITDIVFAGHGISVAGKGELPTQGWAVAETAFSIPQTAAGNLVLATVMAKERDEGALQVLTLLPTIGVSILSTHGVWATATTNVRPGVLAGSSIAVGADVALTTGVLASALNGRLSGRPIGVTTMLFTAPQIAAASYLAATSPSSSRGGWIGLGAWSGALFLHGLVSTIYGHGGRGSDPELPPPPPPPPPPPLPAKAPPPPPFVPEDRPPLMVPEALRVGPTVVSDGVATAVGIGVSGVLF